VQDVVTARVYERKRLVFLSGHSIGELNISKMDALAIADDAPFAHIPVDDTFPRMLTRNSQFSQRNSTSSRSNRRSFSS